MKFSTMLTSAAVAASGVVAYYDEDIFATDIYARGLDGLGVGQAYKVGYLYGRSLLEEFEDDSGPFLAARHNDFRKEKAQTIAMMGGKQAALVAAKKNLRNPGRLGGKGVSGILQHNPDTIRQIRKLNNGIAGDRDTINALDGKMAAQAALTGIVHHPNGQGSTRLPAEIANHIASFHEPS